MSILLMQVSAGKHDIQYIERASTQHGNQCHHGHHGHYTRDHDKFQSSEQLTEDAIEESLTCQFTSIAANGTLVGLPVILNHLDPDSGTLIISSPTIMKRLENVRRHPEVAMLFSPVGTVKEEPPHVLLVQGPAEVDDTDPENGWRRYFSGWARRHLPSRENLSKMSQMIPGYIQRAIICVRPTCFLGWQEGDMQRTPEIVEVNQ